MSSAKEISTWHKQNLQSLLIIKKSNLERNTEELAALQDEIKRAVGIMQQEDVAWVEKIVGIEAIPAK